MKRIDESSFEILISLAAASATYAIAVRLGISGPIAVVVTALLIGSRGPVDALSERSKRYLFGFWEVVDDLLNAFLFVLIGIEFVELPLGRDLALLGLVVAVVTLAARLVAVATGTGLLGLWTDFPRGTIALLTWSGLRGGISIALALSIESQDYRTLILVATYSVVIFTNVVQGLTLARLARRDLERP